MADETANNYGTRDYSRDYSLDWGQPPAPRAPRARRRWLEVLLLAGFLLSVVAGLIALAVLWSLSQRPATPPAAAAFDLLEPERVQPGLAVRALAGDPPAALAAQAIRAGELPTAAALLLFDAQTEGSARAALWRRLGQALQAQGEDAKAALAHRQLLAAGKLDLELHSLERSQSLIQAADGFLAAGDLAAARAAATQARRVVAQSPDLLPAQRSQLLGTLKPVVAQLDAPSLAAEVDDLLRNPFLDPGGVLLTSTWASLSAAPPADALLDAAVAARQQAARDLADRQVLTNGSDVAPEVERLGGALLAEDQVRAQRAQAINAQSISLQQQLGLLIEQRHWRALKLQVANRAFGLTLVPQWEANAEALRQELAANAGSIGTVAAALAAAQPTPLEQNLLRAEAGYRAALQSELGLSPSADNNRIADELRIAATELERLGVVLALPIAYEPDAYPPGFLIQQR